MRIQQLNETLRVLYCIDRLKLGGGSEIHLLDLVRCLTRKGVEVAVTSLDGGRFAENFTGISNCRYRMLGAARIYDLNGIRAFRKLLYEIRVFHPHVVQTFHTAADLVGPLAAAMSGIHPVVLSSRRDLGFTKKRRHLLFQKFVNKYVHGILANSQAVKRAVCQQEGYLEKLIKVIYNGIDLNCFAPAEATPASRNEHILVGSVGNLRPIKGYGDLIKAAHIVINKLDNVKFVIAGDGETKAELMQRAKELGMEDRFIFKGYVQDVAGFLQTLDIYVQPSRSEGFSNAIIQAMATALPVVATNVGGNPEVVADGRNGKIVPASAANTLAETILMLAESSNLRRQFGEAARIAAQKFSIDAMIDEYISFYHKLVAVNKANKLATAAH